MDNIIEQKIVSLLFSLGSACFLFLYLKDTKNFMFAGASLYLALSTICHAIYSSTTCLYSEIKKIK